MPRLAVLLLLAVCAAGGPRLAPRVERLRHDLTPEELRAACERAGRTLDAEIDRIVRTPEPGFATVIAPLEAATSDHDELARQLTFLAQVHPDAAVRAAASDCEERSGAAVARVEGRADLYRAVRAAVDRTPREELGAEERLLGDDLLRAYRRNGADLDDARRERIVALRARLWKLGTDYDRNLEVARLEVDRAELTGMPRSYVDSLQSTSNGNAILTTDYPVVWPLLAHCTSEPLRRRMWLLFWGRGGAPHALPGRRTLLAAHRPRAARAGAVEPRAAGADGARLPGPRAQ